MKKTIILMTFLLAGAIGAQAQVDSFEVSGDTLVDYFSDQQVDLFWGIAKAKQPVEGIIDVYKGSMFLTVVVHGDKEGQQITARVHWATKRIYEYEYVKNSKVTYKFTRDVVRPEKGDDQFKIEKKVNGYIVETYYDPYDQYLAHCRIKIISTANGLSAVSTAGTSVVEQ